LLGTSEAGASGSAPSSLSQYLLPGQYFVDVSALGTTLPLGYTLSTAFTPKSNPNAGSTNGPPPVSVSTNANANPQDLLAADLTGNGILDLVTANGDGTVSVLLGVGDNSFQQPAGEPAGGYPVRPGDVLGRIIAVDYNGDGRLDLAVWDQTNDTVSILLGYGNGAFDLRDAIWLPISQARAIGMLAPLFAGTARTKAPGDFNGLGSSDTAILSSNTVQFSIGFNTSVQAVLDYPPFTNHRAAQRGCPRRCRLPTTGGVPGWRPRQRLRRRIQSGSVGPEQGPGLRHIPVLLLRCIHSTDRYGHARGSQ